MDRPYKGVIDCTSRTFQAEGVYPFWRGNLANCLRYFPTQALNFAFKGQIKRMFAVSKDASKPIKFGSNIAAGGMAGSMSLCFVYSLDYARTRYLFKKMAESMIDLSSFYRYRCHESLLLYLGRVVFDVMDHRVP